MRSSTAVIAALAALACAATPGLAQNAPKPAEKVTPSAISRGEEATTDVDPAVLDRCRQQAEDQKLKDGPARKAFMGTCVTPED